ncbi:MAG: GAF domain-containing protein, partial [bacterium]|nr:GAF domain-containing protein [bacterium]
HVLGVINVNNKVSGDIFTESDRQLLVTLANQIAVALERTEHFKRACEKVEQLSLVYELTKSISSTLKLPQVLDRILDAVMDNFQADRASLMLLDKESGMLSIAASRGIPESVVETLTFEIGEGVAGAVALTGNPLLINNITVDERYKKKQKKNDMTLLSVPLLSREAVIGVLNVERVLDEERDLWPFTGEDQEFLSTLSSAAAVAIENAELYKHLLNAYLGTVQSLAAAIEAKDAYTHGHSTRVTEYSLTIAREMNLSEDDIEVIKHAALLHDIGKIGISDSVLLKPSGLTAQEFNMIKQHPLLGTRILQSVEFLDSVRNILLAHHERYDGKGYPLGLKGKNIPLGGRIIAVADSFDAMISDRPYRRGLEEEKAIVEVENCIGSQFDPRVVKAFLRTRRTPKEADAAD